MAADLRFEEWFAAVWAGSGERPVPEWQRAGWNEYIEQRQLAMGAWEAALAAPHAQDTAPRENDGSTPENPRPDGSYGYPQDTAPRGGGEAVQRFTQMLGGEQWGWEGEYRRGWNAALDAIATAPPAAQASDTEAERIDCAVSVAPCTHFGVGVKLSTVVAAIRDRAKWPDGPFRFNTRGNQTTGAQASDTERAEAVGWVEDQDAERIMRGGHPVPTTVYPSPDCGVWRYGKPIRLVPLFTHKPMQASEGADMSSQAVAYHQGWDAGYAAAQKDAARATQEPSRG